MTRRTPITWRRDMTAAARVSEQLSAASGELTLEPVRRPSDPSAADRPTPVFAIRGDAGRPSPNIVTLVGSRATVDRFLVEARASSDEAAHMARGALPASPSVVSTMPVGSTGGLVSHMWAPDCDPAAARALVAAFNRSSMGPSPFMGFGTTCDLARPLRTTDPTLDPQHKMLTVRPLTTRATAATAPQRVPRWRAPCWPAATIESMPQALRPRAAQLDVDASGRIGLAISPAPGQWIATRSWLVENELVVVSGAERPPDGSWVLAVEVRGAGPWAHLVIEKAKSIILTMPGLAADQCSWGPPRPVGSRVHLELETAPDWQPDVDLAEFDVCAVIGAPTTHVSLLRARTKPLRSGATATEPELATRAATPAAAGSRPQPPPAAPPLRTRADWPALADAAPRRALKRPLNPDATTERPPSGPRARTASAARNVTVVAPVAAAPQPTPRGAAAALTAIPAAAPATAAPTPRSRPQPQTADPPSGRSPAPSPWTTSTEPLNPADAPAPGSDWRWYGVAVGRKTGVFDSWPVAWSLTHRWPANRIKGFDDEASARGFVRNPDLPVWNRGRSTSARGAAAARRRSRTADGAAPAAAAPADSNTSTPRPQPQPADGTALTDGPLAQLSMATD